MCYSYEESLNAYIKSTDAKLCKKCAEFCKTCKDENNCSTCIDTELYSLKDGKCVKCELPNCKACATDGTCKTCDSKFYLSTEKACVACPEFSLACSSSGATSCILGYFLDSGKCSPCGTDNGYPYHCTKAGTPTLCLWKTFSAATSDISYHKN